MSSSGFGSLAAGLAEARREGEAAVEEGEIDMDAVMGEADAALRAALQAQGLVVGGADTQERLADFVQVIPTPSHLLDRISPILSPFFLVFCAFSPPRRDGSNEPQARTQDQETAGTGVQTAGNTVSRAS